MVMLLIVLFPFKYTDSLPNFNLPHLDGELFD